MRKIKFVGHKVNKHEIQPDEDNVKKIKKCKPPTDVKGVRRFLGMTQYYKTFIKGFADIARRYMTLSEKTMSLNGLKLNRKHSTSLKKN